jgi:hypothetical protein
MKKHEFERDLQADRDTSQYNTSPLYNIHPKHVDSGREQCVQPRRWRTGLVGIGVEYIGLEGRKAGLVRYQAASCPDWKQQGGQNGQSSKGRVFKSRRRRSQGCVSSVPKRSSQSERFAVVDKAAQLFEQANNRVRVSRNWGQVDRRRGGERREKNKGPEPVREAA